MANFLEEFMETLGPEVTRKMSAKLGVDPDVTGQILPQLAPMILGGLKKQKDENGGEERIDHILNKYGQADALDQMDDVFDEKAAEENPDPGLGGLLGDSGAQMAEMVSKQFNLDGNTASKLMSMLSPMLLGSLSKARDAGTAGISDIASILDRDGDGSILDDVAGFFTGGLSDAKSGGGLLGGLIGGLLGKKR